MTVEPAVTDAHGDPPAAARQPMTQRAPEPAAAPRPPPPAPVRWLLFALALLCLVLAVVGIVVPGIPTTPFVLLAAWAAARSSPRLARWLESHRLFGQLIRDWREGGRVRRRAKWHATLAMAACAAVLLWLAPSRWIAAGALASMAIVLCWLWLRPEPDALPAPDQG